MSKKTTIVLGVATLYPLIYFIFFLAINFSAVLAIEDVILHDQPVPRLRIVQPLHLTVSIWSLALLLFYFFYVWTREDMTMKERVLWCVLLFCFNLPAALIFWYFYVLRRSFGLPAIRTRRTLAYVYAAGVLTVILIGMLTSRNAYLQCKAAFASKAESDAENRFRKKALKTIQPNSIKQIRVYTSDNNRFIGAVSNRAALAEFADSCKDIQNFFWDATRIEVIEVWHIHIDGTNWPNQYEFESYFVTEPKETVIGLIRERSADDLSWRYYGHFSSKLMYEWISRTVLGAKLPL